MTLKFVSKVCVGCDREFRTANDSDKCYNCTLERITHGCAPGEGDFNTAGIVSGTLTEAERGYLRRDLESVELGTTSEEWLPEEEPDDGREDDWEKEDDDRWEFDELEAARWGDEG